MWGVCQAARAARISPVPSPSGKRPLMTKDVYKRQKQAHVPRFAAARLPMVRRSLPFEDQRGLAFVAAAARPETLVSALDLLGQDSLSAWMTPEDVSLFIALPAGNVLCLLYTSRCA